MNSRSLDFQNLLTKAAQLASAQRGATSPNPPVGALILDKNNSIIAQAAHRQAGMPHAEALALESLKTQNRLNEAHTLVVTLEPCNHAGKTPACTQAILESSIKRLVFGAYDPNPKVLGRGSEFLRSNGIESVYFDNPDSVDLIQPFKKWSLTGLPWVTLKTAHRGEVPDFYQSMIPKNGQKVFTNFESLQFAHSLRKRANAVLTGSHTIFSDKPLFSIRHVHDHENHVQGLIPKRILCILDRSRRIQSDLSSQYPAFRVSIQTDLVMALQYLGNEGVQEVLIEAGPSIVKTVLENRLWDEHFKITHHFKDLIEHFYLS